MKKINVKVVPNAKVEKIQESVEGNLKVWLNEKPVDGKVNEKLVKILAKHYNLSKADIKIIVGLKNKDKIISLE